MTVRVFRNITAGRKTQTPVYSIQTKRRGKGWHTVAHATHVWLLMPSFKVSKAGVARIRATGKKQVVAVVEGTLGRWAGSMRKADPVLQLFHAVDGGEAFAGTRPAEIGVRFNPYQMDAFQAPDGGVVRRAGQALVGPDGVKIDRVSP